MLWSDVQKESQNNPEQWIVWGGSGRETDWFQDRETAVKMARKYGADGLDATGRRTSKVVIAHRGVETGSVYRCDGNLAFSGVACGPDVDLATVLASQGWSAWSTYYDETSTDMTLVERARHLVLWKRHAMRDAVSAAYGNWATADLAGPAHELAEAEDNLIEALALEQRLALTGKDE